jgi:hypothetical protein
LSSVLRAARPTSISLSPTLKRTGTKPKVAMTRKAAPASNSAPDPSSLSVRKTATAPTAVATHPMSPATARSAGAANWPCCFVAVGDVSSCAELSTRTECRNQRQPSPSGHDASNAGRCRRPRPAANTALAIGKPIEMVTATVTFAGAARLRPRHLNPHRAAGVGGGGLEVGPPLRAQGGADLGGVDSGRPAVLPSRRHRDVPRGRFVSGAAL